jgi:3-oxoacyl-[acyl-carrier protein] reductase
MPHDPLSLRDRVCVVTGAARGIGLASALRFATQGATLVLAGRDADALQKAALQARACPADGSGAGSGAATERVETVVCDVADDLSVKRLFQGVFARHRRLDVLLSNAGVLDDALIGMVSRAQIEKVYSVNTFGLLYCAQYASRLMARNGGGSIIHMASIVGSRGNRGQAVYAGSKAAVEGITRSLAKELAAAGIRVNAIAPGFIDTAMTQALPAAVQAQRLASIAMGRIGTPQDVADVALFLASDLSRYVTGQVIGVDGGMLI